MSSPSSVLEAGVRILRHGQLDAAFAQEFLSQSLAEVTHLPTGAPSGRIETVTVPPGGDIGEHPEGSDSTLLHVVAGQVKVLWGRESEHAATAGSGDTVLVPAGIAFQTRNDSPVELLQFILVRGN